MFLWEGGFFLTLLLAGASMVYVAYRRERAFRRKYPPTDPFLAEARQRLDRELALIAKHGLAGFFLSVLDPAWLLWDPKRQALHDKVAETVVVLKR